MQLASGCGWQQVGRYLRGPAALLAGVGHVLVTTLFPGDCRVCGGPLGETGAVPVCRECLGAAEPRVDPGCRRCGDLLPLCEVEDLSFHGMVCQGCRLVPPPFVRAIAYGDYEDELRSLIHLMKYERMPALARRLGDYLADAVQGLQGAAAGELLVVPVPLHGGAQRRRGYNQAELLAQRAVETLRRRCPDWKLTLATGILRRKKVTAQQFELSRRDRRRNLQGAFALLRGAEAQVQGREVLLVDDILTTGATARECAQVLRAAGATAVWVATVARACGTDRPGRAEERLRVVTRWGGPVN